MKKRIVLVIAAVILLLLEVAFIIYQKYGADILPPETETGAVLEETPPVADSTEQAETAAATEMVDMLPLMTFPPEDVQAQQPEKDPVIIPTEPPVVPEAAPVEQPDATNPLDGAGELGENELPRMPF